MPRFYNMLVISALSFVTLCFTGCTKSGEKSSSKTGSVKSDSNKGSSKTQTTVKKKVPVEVTIESVSPKGLKDAIAKHKGKAVLVDYWATWCKPCRDAFPHTVSLSKKHAGEGLIVISVCMDAKDSKEKAIKFLKSQAADIVNLGSTLEDEEESYLAFEIDGGLIPHYKIFDTEGKLVEKISGDQKAKIDAAIMKALRK